MEPGSDKYRLLIERLPDAYAYHKVLTDRKGQPVDYLFIDVNRAFEIMFNLPKDEVLKKKITEVYPNVKGSSFDWISAFGMVARTGEGLRFEHYYKPRELWYEITACSDEPGYFAVFFRDITKSKLFKASYENTNDAITLCALENNQFVDCNERALKLFGFASKEEFVQKKPSEYSPPYQPDGEDSQKRARELVIETLKGNDLRTFEWLHQRKDGSIFPAEVTLTKYKLGNNTILQSNIRDISTRKEAEKALNESEERFRYIAEFSPLPLAIVDEKGNYEYINPRFAEVFGYTTADIHTGKMWFELAFPDPLYRQKVIDAWKRDAADFSKEKVFPKTFTVTCKNGLEKEILFRTVVMDNGKQLIIYEDITERRLAEQKLAAYTMELEQLYHQLDKELDKARQYHERILPTTFPVVKGLSFAAHYQPAQKMGGDFYDVIHKDNKLILYLSDVSGHGLDGAMLSVFIKEAVDSYVNLKPDDILPHKILQHLSRQYRRENYSEDLYFCIFVTVLDLNTLELSYCGAGFQQEMLLCLGNGETLELATKGMFITTYLPSEILTLQDQSVVITPGTTIFLTTDGLMEQGSQGVYYRDRLSDIFYENAHLPAQQVAQAVVEDFRIFNNGSLQGKDDITFLVLQVGQVEGGTRDNSRV